MRTHISFFYSEMKVEKLKEIIEELKMNQSNLVSDLENCKTAESDLFASRQEAKELEDKNLKYRIENVSNQELILQLKANQTKLASEFEKCRYYYIVKHRMIIDCNAQLKDVIKGKQVCQQKYELVCPWSEWSTCSQTCWGIKTRTDRCSNSDEQIKSCNQFSSCPRSGK